ncbi:MAG: hypothetical protein A2Z14_02230 [Chloroflexi bacterium RBG_16_48_8]|nr:MAG: hypothetical protein A2Z14_02230 [Chloroflexi bacterium RBG_16_48_8]
MAPFKFELKTVKKMTTDAIGEPGKRVFYLQAKSDDQIVTLIIEKQQIQSLAIGVEQLLLDLQNRHPDLSQASFDYIESEMSLEKPIDPAFRVGQLGLGYDEESDLLILVARESQTVEEAEAEGAVARFWCTRSQVRAMCHWGLELANRGRPICGNCGQPIDQVGHFCPKSNGHRQ